jgi:hypothetical protein
LSGALPGNPAANHVHHIATLGISERLPRWDIVPALKAVSATGRGGVLGHEYRMPAVGCLAAILVRLGRSQPLFDQFFGVLADGCDATKANHFTVPANQPELCPEVMLAKSVQYGIEVVH